MKCHCEKCNRELQDTEFYTYRKTGQKLELCKKCLTMHIDNFNPDTYVWILEKMDLPYIPEEWNTLREKAFARNPRLTGMSVFGKYVSKMALKQWKDYSWADSERLQKESETKKKENEAKQKEREEDAKERFEAGEISEAEYKTLTSAEVQNQRFMDAFNPIDQDLIGENNPFQEQNFMDESELPDPASELTHEDKIYLAVKWGRTYQPNEWISLEKDYNQMRESFDIQDADTLNTLLLLCKTNLKMNQAIDSGDLDGYQKLARVSDSLRKSAKFTAAQNKEDKANFVDSIGELVALCEREGFIPRYCTDIPQDKVDATLMDMNKYVYKLVTQDLGFGQQIETALKKIQIQKEMEEQEENLEEISDVVELDDEDYEKHYNNIQEQKEMDLEYISHLFSNENEEEED